MKKRWRLLAGVTTIAAMGVLAGCEFDYYESTTGSDCDGGSGVLVTETREVHGFSSVSVNGGARLVVQRTGVESLTITAEDDILPLLRAEVWGGQLLLGPRDGVHISPTQEIVFRLTCRELDGISASGASHATADGIDGNHLRVDLSGASDLVATGWADSQTVSLSGASEYRAEGLVSRVVTIHVSGASLAGLRVSDRLEGSASGASRIEYHGHPVVRVSTSGGSSVRRVGD